MRFGLCRCQFRADRVDRLDQDGQIGIAGAVIGNVDPDAEALANPAGRRRGDPAPLQGGDKFGVEAVGRRLVEMFGFIAAANDL